MQIFDSYKLTNKLFYDMTRPVAEMAAFFNLKPSVDGIELVLFSVAESGHTYCIAKLITTGQIFNSEKQQLLQVSSGEWTRIAKLAVIDVLKQAFLKKVQLPWGILTGVRPGKLGHKLLDSGIAIEQLSEVLQTRYLLLSNEAELLTRICELQRKLLAAQEDPVGIYIGIPFCPSKCSYCSFPSGIIPEEEETQQKFLNFIEQDILAVVQLISMHRLNVTSIYIGGGTPTSLGVKPLQRLLEMTDKHLRQASVQEFTVEAGRPDCFSADKLAVLEAYDVNRISINAQTLHDKTLKLIGRNHTVKDFYRAYKMATNSKINVINTDLIIGLPGETTEDIQFSLNGIKALQPQNLTVHTLTLKKSADLFVKRQLMNLTAASAIELIEYARKTAEQLGMQPYYLYRQHYMLGHLANIGYALPGQECFYNIQMMEERHKIIGIGPSSATKVPQQDGHHLRKMNFPKNLQTYTSKLSQLTQERCQLFADEEE